MRTGCSHAYYERKLWCYNGGVDDQRVLASERRLRINEMHLVHYRQQCENTPVRTTKIKSAWDVESLILSGNPCDGVARAVFKAKLRS